MKSTAEMCGMPAVGETIRFGSFDWEVVAVKPVECEYDPACTYKVDLVIRDKSGNPVNFATGITNNCLWSMSGRTRQTISATRTLTTSGSRVTGCRYRRRSMTEVTFAIVWFSIGFQAALLAVSSVRARR